MLAPISAARRANGWLAISGQVGQIDHVVVPGGIAAEAPQALANLGSVLAANGLTPADVVKATVFLTSLDDYAEMNRHWAEFFDDPRPARSAVAVSALPLGACVEIEAWCAIPPTPTS